MRKFCADPNCHTAIPETEIVCTLHKVLIELDEVQGEILDREAYVANLTTVDISSTCNCDSVLYACDIHEEPFTPEYPGRDAENPYEW